MQKKESLFLHNVQMSSDIFILCMITYDVVLENFFVFGVNICSLQYDWSSEGLCDMSVINPYPLNQLNVCVKDRQEEQRGWPE